MLSVSESGSMFLFSSDGQVVYEITKFNEPCRSWFIDQTVQRGKNHLISFPEIT